MSNPYEARNIDGLEPDARADIIRRSNSKNKYKDQTGPGPCPKCGEPTKYGKDHEGPHWTCTSDTCCYWRMWNIDNVEIPVEEVTDG